MNIKRYLAEDNAKAMQMIKEELGSDAVIINSRRIRQKGIFGFFKKPITEVIVAVDYVDRIEENVSESVIDRSPAKETKDVSAAESASSAQDPECAQPPGVTQNSVRVRESSCARDEEYDAFVYHYYQRLIDVNTRTEIVDYIFEQVLESLGENKSKKAFLSALRAFIREKLGEPYRLEYLPQEKKTLVFLGPTGVGKTTTIAKVAAKLSIFQNKKVGLITADTFRIAAVDQLKTYAEILGLDVSVVYEAQELKEKLVLYADKDYIILDSAGRNHKSEAMKKDAIELLRHLDHYECFLVLSLGSSKNDIKQIINSYHFIDEFQLVFTKLDETENYGNILNARFQCAKRIAFITNGQNVPDDIITMDADKMVDLILGESNDGSSA